MTRLERWINPRCEEHGGRSGFRLLPTGLDAFVARWLLIELAERTLDLQYYIFHDDHTGSLVIDRLIAAADRGVRVRMLLDDWGTLEKKDEAVAALDAHPNVEIRVFNPYRHRTGLGRLGELLTNFTRVNRRMHNKQLIADTTAVVLGGRNIGDEYFEARSDVDFTDLDALTVGAAVAGVSILFDRYWNSPVTYAITELTTANPGAEAYAEARASLEEFERAQEGQAYALALRDSGLAQQLRGGTISFTAAEVRVMADDPAKVERPDEDRTKNLVPQLLPEFAGLREQLMLVSPYFVPGDKVVESLRRLRERGVRVRVLTNSLASTDEVAVYAGYAKYQRALLEAGIELYEISPAAVREGTARQRHKRDDDDPHGSGRSRAALHAKVLIFDCRTFFVGSMNLDPRSAFTNTEIGLMIDAPAEAAQLCATLERALPQGAYRLELRTTEPGEAQIEWVRIEDGREVRYASEPMASAWQRFKRWFYSLLPIEPLL